MRYNFKLQLLFNTIVTFTNNITYLAWSYKLEPLVSRWYALEGKQAKNTQNLNITNRIEVTIIGVASREAHGARVYPHLNCYKRLK